MTTDHPRPLDPEESEFRDLLWDLYEGRLDDPTAARLDSLLLADPRNRRALIEFMQLAASLEWERADMAGKVSQTAGLPKMKSTVERSLVEPMPISTASAPQVAPSNGAPQPSAVGTSRHRIVSRDASPLSSIRKNAPSAVTPSRKSTYLNRLWTSARAPWQRNASTALLAWITAAFIVGAGLAVLAMISVPAAPAPSTATPAERVVVPTFLARYTQARDVRWADENVAPLFGSLLAEGQRLDMLAGLAEVTFHSGAKVWIEGPCTFEVRSTVMGRLISGRLVARVTNPAMGFGIETASTKIIDLGTEFAVYVDPSGSSEVQVLSGAVSLNRGFAAKAEDWADGAVVLEAGQLQRVEPNGRRWQPANTHNTRHLARLMPLFRAGKRSLLQNPAVAIPILNGNFEDEGNGWTFDTGTYGKVSTQYGIWTGHAEFFSNQTSISDGKRTYLGNGNASRILSTDDLGVYQPSTTYRLTWQVGTRSTLPYTINPADLVGLYYFTGSDAIEVSIASIASLGHSGQVGWEDVSLSYTTAAVGPEIGQPIMIGYHRQEDFGDKMQSNLDDARLEATTVPTNK